MTPLLLFVLAITARAQSPLGMEVAVTKVAGGFQFTEGPCWRADGSLLFSDVAGDAIYRWTPSGGAHVHYGPSGNANGLALDAEGRLLLAQHGKRRLARLEADGTETALATHYQGKQLNSPNDVVVKSDGAIYFTDPPYGIDSSQQQLGFYGVYRVTTDAQAPELLVRDLARPNGLAFSPDETRLYIADTNDSRVMVFDVNGNGGLENPRVFVQQPGISPDGIKVDSAGNLYIAGAEGAIAIYSSEGQPLGTIAVPEKTRNLAWGDADRQSLYVTSGSSVYRLRAVPGATLYPEMTLLPAGEFAMGDHHNFVDPGHPSDELPVHDVWIDALWVGTYDVTNRQYAEFLNSAFAQDLIEVRGGLVYAKGGKEAFCETRQFSDYNSISWDGTSFTVADFRAHHPAVGIRWHGAAAYTNWLSNQQGGEACYDTTTWKCDFTKTGYRLPTEAEWEYAARGGQYAPYRNFPWGDDADHNKANWPDSKDPYETGPLPWTTPVGFFDGQLKRKSVFRWPGATETYQSADGGNGFGLHDMSGNVWQWCHDWYNRDYYGVSPYRNPPGPETASPMPDGQPYHVLRGGNWYNGDNSDPGHGRVSNRDPAYFRGPQDPNHPYYHVGFRVVRPAREQPRSQ
ncbi:MAG: SUMF1/EgtB/PvdO family nonheme iron enzyme [Bryobacteraceae bacterium]